MLKDNVMVMASEVGVYDTDPGNVLLKVCQSFCVVLELNYENVVGE
jgi:hypothetical protein